MYTTLYSNVYISISLYEDESIHLFILKNFVERIGDEYFRYLEEVTKNE